MFKDSVHKFLHISMAAMLVFALAFGASGVQVAHAAGLTVNTTADDTTAGNGSCTLREAITNANADSDTTSGDCAVGSSNDSITFSVNGAITLFGSQLPAVTTTITITGNGAANTIIQASTCKPGLGCTPASYRVFEVSSTGNLSLDGLTVQYGVCTGGCATDSRKGGGLYNAGTVSVTNSTFSNNLGGVLTSNGGGGIYSLGTLSVTNSTFSGNVGETSAGGIWNDGGTLSVTDSTFSDNMAPHGGGIASFGTATVTNTSFSGNTAADGGGIRSGGTLIVTNSTFSNNSASFGGGIENSGMLTVTNSTFSGNSALQGGSIDNSNPGTVTITDSTFSSNSASQGGGAINNDGMLTVNNSTFSSNNAMSAPSSSAGGGGIRNAGTLTVLDSTFSGNYTGFSGGGIVSFGSLTVTSSNFSGNTADVEGGGLRASGATVTDSTFTNNSGAIGGGIFAQPFGGVLRVTDSIISGNTGYGIYNNGADVIVLNSTISNNTEDGIHNQGGLTVMNSTFSNNNGNGILSGNNLNVTNSSFSNNNRGIYGGNGALDLTNSTFSTNGEGIRWQGGLRLRNTISANSTSGADCFASFMLVNVRNLIEDGSCSPALSGDPMLDALADKGGPTQTMALQTGSPAIDAGDDATCAAAPVNNLDQRGVTRPIDGDTTPGAVCDIGAYEAPDTISPSVTIDQSSGQADPTTNSPINFTAVFSEPVTGFDGTDVDFSASTAAGTLSAVVTGGPATYNVAVSGMTSAGDVVASIPANAATDGGSNGNTASTSTDNTVTYVTSSPTALLYNGAQVAGIGSSFQAGARLSSPSAACVSGQTISFSLDVNPLNGSAGPYSLGTALTNSSGQATLTVNTTGWQEGIYIITASFSGTSSCDPSSDSATLTAAAPGNSATGGGWYTLSGSGRVNFGFNVRKVDNKCTSNCAYKGHMLLMNNGKWKLKGTLNTYVKSSTGVGTAGGTGDLYWWDNNLNGGLGDWALAKSGVTYTISFYDGGSGKKPKTDTFGINIKYTPVSPQPSSLPNSGLTPLKGGDIKVQ